MTDVALTLPDTDMPTIAYTGCRTSALRQARGKGIEVFVLDERGTWAHTQSVGGLINPSYLLVDAERFLLFCVHGDEDAASAFRIDPRTGRLALLNTQRTHGRNPVHLCLTERGECLVVANYATGSVVALPVGADGSLGPVASTLTLSAEPGPHPAEQRGPHPHQVLRRPGTNHFIFPDKGADSIWFAEFDSTRSSWHHEGLRRIAARPGAGPRHGAFHPTLPLLYIVNELDSTLATYRLDPPERCELIAICDLLPSGFAGPNQSAGIVVDRDGMRLFVSNRGHDTLSMLNLDASAGRPQLVGWMPTEGKTPRFITADPATRNVVVANEGSDTIQVFPIDTTNGFQPLGTPRSAASTGSPTCVAFFETSRMPD